MADRSTAADPWSVRRTALACVLVAVLRAQSPQETAAARQRDSILRQQQALAASAQGRSGMGERLDWALSASAPPASAARVPATGATALAAQLASIERQQAAFRLQKGLALNSAGPPAGSPPPPAEGPGQAVIQPGAQNLDAGLAASLARQIQAANLQPRPAWPQPPEPATLPGCAPLPVAALAPVFDRAAASYGLESSLLRAVARRESGFQPCAVSRAGAMGLMQLMPETAATLGVEDPFDPEQSILGGARFLRFLLDRFQNDLSLALSAYNAGPARVERHGGIPPIPETQDYVSSILQSLGKPPPE